MNVNDIFMYIFAIGVLIGGVDYLLGNKYGYGEKFQEAVKLMAPTVFNMVGIICLTPAIAVVIRMALVPLYELVGIDPGMLGGVLAIDMGGHSLAMELCNDMAIGEYSGILVGSTLGCSLVFSIPIGMGIIKRETQGDYLTGVIYGLIAMPFGLIVGGLVQGLHILVILFQSIPVLILSLFLIIGLWKFPNVLVRFFMTFAKGLKILMTIGLIIAVVLYLLGIETEYITPITQGMNVVVGITLTLMGSLPIAKLLIAILSKPMAIVGKGIGISKEACGAILIGLVSAVPVYTMLDDMDKKSRIVVSAFLINGMAILGAHFGYAATNAPDMVGPMLTCKIIGAVGTVLITLFCKSFKKKHPCGTPLV